MRSGEGMELDLTDGSGKGLDYTYFNTRREWGRG